MDWAKENPQGEGDASTSAPAGAEDAAGWLRGGWKAKLTEGGQESFFLGMFGASVSLRHEVT